MRGTAGCWFLCWAARRNGCWPVTLLDDLPRLLRGTADETVLLSGLADPCSGTGALLTAAASMDLQAVAQHPCLPQPVLREAANAVSEPDDAIPFLKRSGMPDVDKIRFVRDRCLPPYPDAAEWAAGLASAPNLPVCVYEQLLDTTDPEAIVCLMFNETVPLDMRRSAALTVLPSVDQRTVLPNGRLSAGLVADPAVFDLLVRHRPRFLLDRHYFVHGLTARQLSQYVALLETHASAYDSGNSLFHHAAALLLHPALTRPLLDRVVRLYVAVGPLDQCFPSSMDRFEQYVVFATDRVTMCDSAALYRKYIDIGFFDDESGFPASVLRDPEFTPQLLRRLLERPLSVALTRHLLRARAHTASLLDVVQHLVLFSPEALADVCGSVGLPKSDKYLVEAASPVELAAALHQARPVPELASFLQTLIVSHAPARNLTSDVVQHFMCTRHLFDVELFASDPADLSDCQSSRRRLTVALCRVMCWLADRFGGHEPAWVMFAELADGTLPVREVADLAVALEPPPSHPKPSV